jgi:hypothetical protein
LTPTAFDALVILDESKNDRNANKCLCHVQSGT